MTRRRERETPEYSQMVRRIIRGHGRRCADADPEDLAELIEMSQTLDEAITEAVAGLRRNGFSWAQIAAPLGITRQAAQMRFGAPVSELHSLAPAVEPGPDEVCAARDSNPEPASKESVRWLRAVA